MNKSITLLVSALLIAALSWFAISKPPKAEAADKQLVTALTAFNQRKYAEAAKLFAAIEKTKSTDASVQYYLGASALLSGNQGLGRDALCRSAVMTFPKNPFHLQAVALLEKYFRCKPYCCLQNFSPPKTFRWAKSAMPIKVFVSDGRMFPAKYHKTSLDSPDIRQLATWAKSGAINKLPVVPEFQSQFKAAVSRGISRWAWAAREQLLTYQLVADPSKADIVVAWCPNLGGDAGLTSYANSTNAIIIQMAMSGLSEARGDARVFCIELENVAAHEFGHAVGLNHSDTRGDLMFPQEEAVIHGDNNQVEIERATFTANDKAAVRGLYTGITGVLLPFLPGR